MPITKECPCGKQARPWFLLCKDCLQEMEGQEGMHGPKLSKGFVARLEASLDVPYAQRTDQRMTSIFKPRAFRG